MAELDGNPCRIVALTRTWSQPLRHNGIEIQELPVVERYLLIDRKGVLYVLTYVVAAELDTQLVAVFEHVVRSFHFRPAEAGGGQ